jgi:26S proteasome regulatory subunit N5
MSSGQVLKAEKDFTKEVDKVLPEAQELAKVGSKPFNCAF